jgi:hypothetical protein
LEVCRWENTLTGKEEPWKTWKVGGPGAFSIDIQIPASLEAILSWVSLIGKRQVFSPRPVFAQVPVLKLLEL